MHVRMHPPSARRAAATVELAAIVPLLGLLTVGMIEVTRAIQVKHYLTDAARSACRLAILPGSSNDQVTAAVNQVLTGFDIDPSDAATTFQVNGVAADVSTANQGDRIAVKVSVPVAKVSWVAPFIFSSQSVESETLVMMRQL
jgi:Flp pilus assembly protein TadG